MSRHFSFCFGAHHARGCKRPSQITPPSISVVHATYEANPPTVKYSGPGKGWGRAGHGVFDCGLALARGRRRRRCGRVSAGQGPSGLGSGR